MKKKPNASELSWTLIFKQLQEDGIEFFLNTNLEPTVLIPSDGFQQEWPVNSERFQDQVISVGYEVTDGEMLKPTEKEFLMAQIRLECRRGGRRLTAPEAEETDKDVIVQAILALMNQTSEFSGFTAALVKRLHKFQSEGSISMSGEIPIFTNIFSRKLNRLIPVLGGYGVEVRMEHREDGSHCLLKRLDSFQKEPSPNVMITDGSKFESSGQSSGTTTRSGKDLPPTDDSDGEFRQDSPAPTDGSGGPKNPGSPKKGGAK